LTFVKYPAPANRIEGETPMEQTLKEQSMVRPTIFDRHGDPNTGLSGASAARWLAARFTLAARRIWDNGRAEIDETRLTAREPWLDVYRGRMDRY